MIRDPLERLFPGVRVIPAHDVWVFCQEHHGDLSIAIERVDLYGRG